MYCLLSDYNGPGIRGKIYDPLQTMIRFGCMLGLVVAIAMGGSLGW